MKLKILMLTCAVGLLALETGIKAIGVPAGCETECAKGTVKCKICAFEKKASGTVSEKLSSTTSHKSSGTSSHTTSGTSSHTTSGTSSDTSSGMTSGTSSSKSGAKTEESNPTVTAALKLIGTVVGKAKAETICNTRTFGPSLQSLSGAGCKNKVMAAFAAKKCKNIDGFHGSKCELNIEGALKGKSPDEVLDAVANNDQSKLQPLAKKLQAALANNPD